MPTSHAPLQPLQLPPPVSFQQQQTHPPLSTGTHFVPPPIAANPTIPNVYAA